MKKIEKGVYHTECITFNHDNFFSKFVHDSNLFKGIIVIKIKSIFGVSWDHIGLHLKAPEVSLATQVVLVISGALGEVSVMAETYREVNVIYPKRNG